MKKKKGKIIIFLICCFLFTTGFTHKMANPKTVYRVYLEGKSIGLIKSKIELEDYIDKKQDEIKKKYGVKKVYAPSELDIEKEITFSENIDTVEDIYEKIKDISPFTISGYIITISGIDTKDNEGKIIKGKKNKIYVIKKNIFKESVENTVKSLISEEDFNVYKEGKQKEIQDTGKIIENIYIQNKITIKKGNIPVNQPIYMTKDELSKYLLFGTTEDQAKYIVQDGDTIEDVAFNNKISTEEFIIANPTFTSANSLLYQGQVVTIGIIKPQFNVISEEQVVFREEQNYQTETRYDDDKLVSYSEVIQAGAKGENKVTQKIQKVNGETTIVVPLEKIVLKEPVTEVILKGTKKPESSYYGQGYGVPIPTKGEWGWPATCSSISSPFGWRWGTLHDGTDIAGCGYGSNIFAAQSGTVIQSSSKYDNGQYITIDHHNGYYTMYAHLCVGCRYVQVGDEVVKGQVIGGMGQTGFATGVHLHFGMWYGYPYRGGTAVNALNYY